MRKRVGNVVLGPALEVEGPAGSHPHRQTHVLFAQNPRTPEQNPGPAPISPTPTAAPASYHPKFPISVLAPLAGRTNEGPLGWEQDLGH